MFKVSKKIEMYTPKKSNLDVRESMRVLPNFSQPFLTWLTGKPLKNQKPWHRSPIHHLVVALALLVTGVSLGILALTGSSLALLIIIPSWMLTVSGSRTLQSMISHQCAHFNFSGHKNIDRLLGKAISILITIRDFEVYQRDHTFNHHPKLSTVEDETVKFLILVVGMRPGMAKGELWKKLIRTLFSSRFHWLFLKARISSTYNSLSTIHNIIALTFTALVFAIITICKSWVAFLVIWVFPLTILYQISTCLRLCSEHLWSEDGLINKPEDLNISRLTVGIFLGEATPDPSLPILFKAKDWCIWCFRMLFIHLICRIFVMVGDTPCHDYHHRHPLSTDWPNYIFSRQRDVDAGCPGTTEVYREVWGLYNAIDKVFESISQLTPENHEYTDNPLGSVYSLSTIAKSPVSKL